MNTCSFICSGEPCCKTEFDSEQGEGYLALTPRFPAKVVPVHLAELAAPHELISGAGTFFASVGDVTGKVDFDCCSCNSCCAGMGSVRQKISGTGTAFFAGGGTVLQKKLNAGEKIVVDSGSVLAFEKTVELGFQRTGGCCTMCCGGEGMFNTTLTGPGLVMLHSMPFAKYRKAVAPAGGGDGGGGGGDGGGGGN